MIKIENTEVVGWEHAIRGMRNPMNSWDKSDSKRCNELYCACGSDCADLMCDESSCDNFALNGLVKIGENDLTLMKKLAKAGTDHRKFMRMIVVYCDINAPMYWWKEFDTYKVGTVRNSCSTMHKLTHKEFELEDFSFDSMLDVDIMNKVIADLNWHREWVIEKQNASSVSAKQHWYQMVQLLPSSYNQRSTVMLNYEVLANMYHSRKTHKLNEWREFCYWIACLPYSELITGEE